ncbi:ferredoxin [Cryptosporangium aurantiacum]|uniref:Ferredoxin n=1 Tax=Cryptosporangium aurantiacum TaxID=134849 RepID=A0A1M7TUG1_9ACTN|nr:ferredoxin [Cryptosporangium aurantiacum]SHN74351.1 ferredoxin [Cryptosporangium aurantiacum]
MKILVDFAKCTGLGLCEAAAPELFEIDDDGGLVVLVDDVPPGEVDAARAAVVGCPTAALQLTDE